MHNIAASLLKARLKDGGLTGKALAARLWPDLPANTAEVRLHRALNGGVRLTLEAFCQIALALGASPAKILADAEKKSEKN